MTSENTVEIVLILLTCMVLVYTIASIRWFRHGILSRQELGSLGKKFDLVFRDYNGVKEKLPKVSRQFIADLATYDNASIKDIIKECVEKFYYSDNRSQVSRFLGVPWRLIARYVLVGSSGFARRHQGRECDLSKRLIRPIEDQNLREAYCRALVFLFMLRSYEVNFLYGVFFRRVIMRCYFEDLFNEAQEIVAQSCEEFLCLIAEDSPLVPAPAIT